MDNLYIYNTSYTLLIKYTEIRWRPPVYLRGKILYIGWKTNGVAENLSGFID